MEAHQVNHKTVFVINHSREFLKPSGETFNLDIGKNKTESASFTIPPISKTYWTCAVEAIIEYCRIIFDIHASEKWFSITSIDSEVKILSAWYPEDQKMETLWDLFTQEGPPSEDISSSKAELPGLKSAVEVLGMPTPDQQEGKVEGNSGRIVYINTDIKPCLQECMRQAEEIISQSSVNLDYCECIFIDLFPNDTAGLADAPSRHPGFPSDPSQCNLLYYPSVAGKGLTKNLVRLCESHFGLALTSIVDIPMKEEQNTTNSSYYGVELLHKREAHDVLKRCGVLEHLLMTRAPQSGISSGIAIKWVTPKSSDVDLQFCTGSYRCTTADVCGRAAVCLAQFVLSGRCVTLEQTVPNGHAHLSREVFLLASHGGVMYLHVLNIHRDPLEGRPAITEGCGGRVTDYRVTEFAELAKMSRLAPASDRVDYPVLPRERARMHLERYTRYWPISIADTVIFSKALCISPLLECLPKEFIEAEDIQKCRAAIIQLISMENQNETLPVTIKGKQSTKREEQYRIAMTELEHFLRLHSSQSSAHAEILTWFLRTAGQSRLEPTESGAGPLDMKPTGLPTLDRMIRETREEKPVNASTAGVKRKADTPLPDGTLKKEKVDHIFSIKKSGMSFKEIYLSRMKAKQRQRPEFAGVLESKGNITELYKHMNDDKGA